MTLEQRLLIERWKRSHKPAPTQPVDFGKLSKKQETTPVEEALTHGQLELIDLWKRSQKPEPTKPLGFWGRLQPVPEAPRSLNTERRTSMNMDKSTKKVIAVSAILFLVWLFFTQGLYMNPLPPPLKVWGGRLVDVECMQRVQGREEIDYYLCTRTLQELRDSSD